VKAGSIAGAAAFLLLGLLLARPALAQAQAPPSADPKKKAGEASSPRPTPKPAVKPKPKLNLDGGPVVMSADAAAEARGAAASRDRYASEPDWRDVPPHRQASFFGIRAEGQVFVFVVDCSGSMIDEDRLDRAKSELMRSIRGLREPQRFKVIFYNDQPVPMPGEIPRLADRGSKDQLSRWLDLIQPDGGTNPKGALELALGVRPDAVFLLSDGAFPAGTAAAVARANPRKIPIHCVDLADGAGGDDLQRIARESGGRYTARGR
jgi:hypothetical protein